MQIIGEPKIKLREEALDFINLYASLGEKAEIFLPKDLFDNLKSFVKLCYEEPNDPAQQLSEINDYILKFREEIPGYSDVSLMLYPNEDSKAFQYTAKRNKFKKRLKKFIDTEILTEQEKEKTQNILNSHDLSIGTPPVNSHHIDFMSEIQFGDQIRNLRKFRDVIGVVGDINEAHWNYLMDALDQMVVQSSHYTTKAEITDFLHRSQWAVNFKGLNGFIRTVVSGNADSAVNLIKGEVFSSESVIVLDKLDPNELYKQMQENATDIFVVKVPHMRTNTLAGDKWFNLLTRLIIVDDSPESRSSNTSLVFCFHNKVINTLNKVHTKKYGSPANTQLNIRLILENVNAAFLKEFRTKIERQIEDYNIELEQIKASQVGELDNVDKNINLFKLDEFSMQILKDRYSLEKLRDFIFFLENTKNPKNRHAQAEELVDEFEKRTKSYFFSDNPELNIATIVEGGGRNQIKTYGEYLIEKNLKKVNSSIINRCEVILDVIPNNYQRTLHNHFHKNFGINLFMEQYQQHITKIDNEADNKGRFRNFLIDLGIYETFLQKNEEEQQVIKDFLANLGNLDKTSISDSAQMIIYDLFFNINKPKPYIIYNTMLSWEYKDLLPDDKFDLNPFDIEIQNFENGRTDYERLTKKLQRIKATLALFDESGNLWDRFCENTTIVINDPSNPTGYSDHNSEALVNFLRFLNTTKITLFLDEAYNDAVKYEDDDQPKWRSISRYILNNITALSKISMVSSLSTTKNLGATGNRLGSIIATPAKKDMITFAKQRNGAEKGNNNSIFMLNNILQISETARKIKKLLETELPKDASRQKIKDLIIKFVKNQIIDTDKFNKKSRNRLLHKTAQFEGSQLYVFLLNELKSLDKLDIFGVADDFKYGDEPFFSYYHRYLLKELNKFRVNRNFRTESNRRLKIAKNIAFDVLKENKSVTPIDSDGSFLFNIQLNKFSSYSDLLLFTKALAAHRGVSAIPYPTGMIRFSLGGFLKGDKASYSVFEKEIENALLIFIKYYDLFYKERVKVENKEVDSCVLISDIFKVRNEREFLDSVFEDYEISYLLKKDIAPSLLINDIRGLYHSSPAISGVSITTIGRSVNSVIEFQGEIGNCTSLEGFIRSKAFTKVYENLLAQIYLKIPTLNEMNFNTVISRFGKATLLKYITNKKSFQPNRYIFDNQDEMNIMREILIEMEKLLFSDTKTKILTIDAQDNVYNDKAKLEGVNKILRKYIQEMLLHFNLPFEQKAFEPSRKEIIEKVAEKFEEVTGIHIDRLNLKTYTNYYIRQIIKDERFEKLNISEKSLGSIFNVLFNRIINEELSLINKILYLYLLKNDDSFLKLVSKKLRFFESKIKETQDGEMKIMIENFIMEIIPDEFDDILNYIFRKQDIKVEAKNLKLVSQKVVLFYIEIINRTTGSNYYDKYNHSLIKLIETEFKQQNSSYNEMIQHGISLYRNFEISNKLSSYENGNLSWINNLMSSCGVIATEQPVQTHTRIATDAKKREYPFHKIDREEKDNTAALVKADDNPNDYIKTFQTRPESQMFAKRLSRFVANMDYDDYRCKIVKNGIINELYVFQKGYMKYLTDNFRLLESEDVDLNDIKNFVPDIFMFLGAPEKVISFPQVGYFDIKGPNGNIKTIVTPLKSQADYFGDVKKPRLTIMNEKVKEMGGVPKHGSLFAVEEEDGSIFGIEICGDSGVGKSEMIAALVLKWLKEDLQGIRSVKMIAGDMFHEFQDAEGNLYGVGTEVGDFSRVTDFDPDFIKYYKYLFESSADSNVEDLNSRSTITGFCEINQPCKIDIMLTASNYSTSEAGITRVDNGETFLKYINAHGERKEKATSQDGPNFQRTLKRFTADKNVVDVLAEHGNYIDVILDWDFVDAEKNYYLCSSYKMIDKINIEEIVNKIFVGKEFDREGVAYRVEKTSFDIIKNRFQVKAVSVNNEEGEETIIEKFFIDRYFFSEQFDSIASTPAGQPFISEENQDKANEDLILCLKGGKNRKGNGKKIQCGILSTEIGKKGKEISGPQKAAEAMKKMIQEVRINNPEINRARNEIKRTINDKYFHIFGGNFQSTEIWRYNFYISQLNEMQKADFRRMDDISKKVDLSRIKNFETKDKNSKFSPLLVTPMLNIELNSFSETYEELMSLPNYPEFASEFSDKLSELYVAEGYSEETKVNNLMIQLLLSEDYITIEDVAKGRVIEKVNRETIAAAKYAVTKFFKEAKAKKSAPAPTAKKAPAKKPTK
jgi:hypothetical protein